MLTFIDLKMSKSFYFWRAKIFAIWIPET